MGRGVIMHALMSFMLNSGYEDLNTTTITTTTTATTTATTIAPGCYKGYGCFPTDGVWGGTERPVSLHPLPPTIITPTFCLHTPARPQCHVLDVDAASTFTSSSLHTGSPLFLVTHGYLESTQLAWVKAMVGGLLTTGGSVGVVTVDWSTGALPTYAQAVANTRLVGVVAGRLMARMAELGVSPEAMHLIGHSLGAHLMGYAADAFTATRGIQVGRISGLDPAGPYFTNTSSEVRLDSSDAAFVDIIHTDVPTHPWDLNRLGYAEPAGHADFYPNGGREQAGCEGSAAAHIGREETVVGGVLSYIGCSHQRSYHYFTESITTAGCRFVGVECGSWEEYLAGACWGCAGGPCTAMGYPATPPPLTQALPRSPKRIFFGTNSESPFCGEQYRVTVVTARGRGQGDLARFTVTLRGRLRTSSPLTLPAPPRGVWVEAGGREAWVGWGRGGLGGVNSLQVAYEQDHSLLQALVWRFQPPTLYVEAFLVEALSTATLVRFPFCGAKMQAGQSYTLLPDASCQ